MTADSRMVVVTETSCNTCGTPQVGVYHQYFPEMSIRGESPGRAAEELAIRLEANLDAVTEPSHRERVRRAIADVRAYLTTGVVQQPKLSEVNPVAVAEPAKPGLPSSTLAKTETP